MLRPLAAIVLVAVALVVLSTPAGAQVDSSFLAKIPKAIDHGVEWLKGKQIKDGDGKGSWGFGENPVYPGGSGPPHRDEIGITALALLTLLSCDVLPEDPVVVEGWGYIDRKMDWTVNNSPGAGKMMVSTYEVGVLLMALEAMEDGRYWKGKKRDPKGKRPPIKLSAADDAKAKALVGYLTRTQSPDGGWRYGPGFPSPHGVNQDVSATQVVLLGLNSALRMNVPVDPEVFANAARWNLKLQEKEGPPARVPGAEGDKRITIVASDQCRGWAYLPDSADDHEKRVSGSMTACGICSLILAKSALLNAKKITPTLQKNIDKGVFDGLAWLDMNWMVDKNPGGHRSHYYYLYGLERVGVLGNMEKIGTHNWYIEGAQVLIANQVADGHWDSGSEVNPRDVIDTCFALLFLKKATVPIGTIITR